MLIQTFEREFTKERFVNIPAFESATQELNVLTSKVANAC